MKIYKSHQRNQEARRLQSWLEAWLIGGLLILPNLVHLLDLDVMASIMLMLVPNILFFVLYSIIAIRHNRAAWNEEKQAQQQRHDAQDEAMFGKPLRDFES